jgi:glycosyltransferase involved in cell wall biosynthesis
LLTFEIPYNYDVIRIAKNRGIKTVIQNNWEFTDYLKNADLPLPDLLVNHSYWHLDEQKARWPQITGYCPTPIFTEDYDDIMLGNLDRPDRDEHHLRRFVHIAGRKTYQDRNGTQDLLDAMKLVPKDEEFELVIKSQNADVGPFNDKRITIDRSMPVDEKQLYRGFDVMVMPRKYGGASLPMNEALMAGLPVIMPRIDPNDKILPNNWLVQAKPTNTIITRTSIEVYASDHQQLANKLVELNRMPWADLVAYKIRAREIAVKEFSSEVVKQKWAGLMSKIGLK